MEKFKIILIGMVLSLAVVPNALAFEKGTSRIGGNSFFNYDSINEEALGISNTTKTTDLKIEVGHFLANNFELGLGFEFFSINDDLLGSSDVTSFSPYVRFYFPTNENYWAITGGLQKISSDDMDVNGIFVGGGYIAMIANDFSLDFGLIYETGSADVSGVDADMDGFGLRAGISFYH